MAVVAIQGVRGGNGTTSVTAALGWALANMGEKVLIIDLSPDNMLRLHFSMPFENPRGWASALLDDQPWFDGAMQYNECLHFLPFGQVSADWQYKLLHDQHVDWKQALSRLKSLSDYQWILLDVPAGNSLLARQTLTLADKVFLLICSDAQCNVRLHQQAFTKNSHFLVNQFSPTSPLQQDILLLWQQTLMNLMPIVLHRDEAMASALANKLPVGENQPHSKVSEEIITLANWCLIHLPRASYKN
jgi:cellulose synthase operon protein YhjQ